MATWLGFRLSLYYYLGAGGNQIMRFYLLYFPANPFSGLVNFGKKGLAPLSMPGHAAFTGVDSRVARSGNWMGVGLVYTY